MNEWLKKLLDVKNANKAIIAAAKADNNRALTDDEQKTFNEGLTTIENCKVQLQNEEAVKNLEAEFTTVVNNGGKPPVGDEKAKPIYNNLASQLFDVRNAATTGQISEKLQKVQNASGMGSGVGSDGGFAIQTDFAGAIFESAVKDEGILSLVDEYTVSGSANSVSWIDINESDVSENVFGGIQVYWAAEAQAVSESKPKLKEEKIELEKLMGLAFATMELDQDSTFLDGLLTKGFTTAIRRKLVGGIIDGTGIGQMTGILKGKGLLTIDKESGQTKETINHENITEMYHRVIEPRGGGYVWLVHPDAHKELEGLTKLIGTGGLPVYLPASMTGAVDTLRGLPVIATDHCSALGTAGDIILADLSDYFMPVKNQIQKDVSIHVKFDTAQNAFRFIFRANGRPKTNHLLKIKNSTKKRARYAVIANRA